MCVDLRGNSTLPPVHLPPALNHVLYNDTTNQMTAEEQREFAQRLQRQLSQISGMSVASSHILGYRGGGPPPTNGQSPAGPQVDLRHQTPKVNLEAAFNAKHSKTFIDNMDFEFVSQFPVLPLAQSCYISNVKCSVFRN